MQIPKPSEDDKQFFRSILPEDPEVEVKPMGGYLSLPPGMDPDLAAGWVEKARVHVGSMPPKVKKPARKKSPTTS